MPNIRFTSQQLLTFFPLPGRSIIEVSPGETMSDSGLLHLPETAVQAREEVKAMRRGRIIKTNFLPDKYDKDARWNEDDVRALQPGVEVLYLGHMDEMDNDHVIVRHGQICAILGPDAG